MSKEALQTNIIIIIIIMSSSSSNNNNNNNETKLFWSKIWQRKEHNRKAEWIQNIEKGLQGHKKALIWKSSEFAQSNTEKISNWETLYWDGM